MNIDVIFLGLDGVLFDTEDLHLAACNAAFAQAGLSLRWTLPALRAAADAHGRAGAVGAVLGTVGTALRARDRARLAALVAEKHRQFHQMLVAATPPVLPAAQALIADAQQAGCKICVLTDLPSPAAAALLEHGYGDRVNSLFTVAAGGVAFDTPAGTGPYVHALNAMGADPQAAIAVDSAGPALRAAAEAGLWTVSVTVQGADVARPRQFITFDALRGLCAGPATPAPRQPGAPHAVLAA